MIGNLTALCPEQKRNDNGYSIGANPFLWLMSLEVQLRTLCKAGSYLVTDPEDDRPGTHQRTPGILQGFHLRMDYKKQRPDRSNNFDTGVSYRSQNQNQMD